MNTYIALAKREILDGKNGYIRVPVILAAITIALVVLSAAGIGEVSLIDDFDRHDIHNLGDALERGAIEEPEEMPAGITVGYWAISILTWMAFPFVLFFSLLSALYEERRDRSILFWKSMPVDDWQEVLVKLAVPVVGAPLFFLAVTIAAQLVIAFLLSIVVLFQGGPVLELWPLGLMIGSWISAIGYYLIWALWALPVLAWVLFVSAYANRLPFMWAILVPVVIMVAEGLFFDTHEVLRWVGIQMGGWEEYAFGRTSGHVDGPRDALAMFFGRVQWEALTYSLGSLRFWTGLLVAAGFTYGAIELRKRAS